MNKQENLSKSILIIALGTGLLLSIPLIAMQFTTEVNWGVGDFLIMGALIFTTGLTFKLITRNSNSIVYRFAIAAALGSGLLLIWANLAVGLIGAGPNLGNLMYIGVIAVGLIGTIRSGFKPAGMEWALYATALSVVLVAVIALIAGMQNYPGSSVVEILGVNGFFASLFAVSGALFHNASREGSAA